MYSRKKVTTFVNFKKKGCFPPSPCHYTIINLFHCKLWLLSCVFQAPAGMTTSQLYTYSSSSPQLATTTDSSVPQQVERYLVQSVCVGRVALSWGHQFWYFLFGMSILYILYIIKIKYKRSWGGGHNFGSWPMVVLCLVLPLCKLCAVLG